MTRARHLFASGLAVAMIWGTAAQTGTRGPVVTIDGMVVDLLDSKAEPGIGAPNLAVNMDAMAGRIVPRTLDAPPPTPPEREQAQRHYARAIDYLKQSDLPKASLEVRDGLTYAPDEVRLLGLAAVLASQSRDFDAAAGYFRRCLELEPGNLQHLASFVAVLLRLSRMEEADHILAGGEAVAPDFMAFRFHRACLQIAADRFQPARAYWAQRPIDEVLTATQWLQADRPDLAKIIGAGGVDRLTEDVLGPRTSLSIDRIHAALETASAARTAQKWPDAVKNLREVATLGVDGYGVRTALAEALEMAGDRTAAIAEWRRILTDHGGLVQVWVSFGHVLLRGARFDEALPVIRRAKELAPNEPVIDFLHASALALTGKIAEAQALYADLVARHPRDLRKWIESDAVFEAALERLPNRTAILRRLDVPPEME